MKNLVWKNQEKISLNEFLRNKIKENFTGNVSNSKIRRLIFANCVSVNGKVCINPSFQLKKGDTVVVNFDEEKFFYEKQVNDIDFVLTEKDVLFEDEYIIVVNKPAFLPTEGTFQESRNSMHKCVIDYLWKKNPSLRNPPYVGIMHRLDKETSGVLLFTKSREANKSISEQFSKHSITKKYKALCNLPKNYEKHFFVEGTIGRISKKGEPCKMGFIPPEKGGQVSKTEFTVEQIKNGYALVDCNLFTGRTHQIRLHLSKKNMSIVGDTLYGGNSGLSDYNNRIMLHSYYLEFIHPISNETMKINCDCSF